MPEPGPAAGEEFVRAGSIERRAFVRYASDLDASCRQTGTAREVGWFARVRDISAGGIGLLFRHRLTRGTPLVVELKRTDGSVVAVLTAHVVHATAVRDQGDLCWLVGCVFERPLADDELRALLG